MTPRLAIARSPLGVAIGVSGDVHLQSGAQPIGQVPVSLGATHVAPVSIGPCGSQQSCPAAQQLAPQHVSPFPQVDVHGRGVHVPPVQ